MKERQKAKEDKNHNKHAKFYITALDPEPKLSSSHPDEFEMNQEERERVIELLLGKEKVINLLYDRKPGPDFKQEV